MLFWIIIRSSLLSLMANKTRSLLAMLGIIIGVGAVIAMLAMGAGAQQQILNNIQAMGTNLLMVRPAQISSGGVFGGQAQTMDVGDAVALSELPGVEAVTPAVQGQAQVQYANRNSRTSVAGGSVTFFQIRNFQIDQGRAFTEEEAEGLARVAVLGPVTATNLFGGKPPLGEKVRINGVQFTVIGITKAKGDQGWSNPDDQVFVPYTTAMKILFGQTVLKEIDVQCADGVDLNEVSGEPPTADPWHREGFKHDVPPPITSIAGVLRLRHKLAADAPDDFRVQSQADIIAMASDNIWTFRILLASIALISLLVGGIGIMNIMLVTVTERTREIGTRKAIGAKNRDILLQFLVESIVMSGVGGTLGALMGIGLAKGIPMIPLFNKFLTIVQPPVVVMSISVAAFVGIFFGLYPAYRASRLDPIERFGTNDGFIGGNDNSRRGTLDWKVRMTKRCVVTAMLAAVTAVVAGCSSLDLGPEPSNFVGSSERGATSLTDPSLNAVTPLLTPTVAQGVVEYSATTMPGEGTTPQTMPAATQPNTTQPAAPTTNPQQRAGLGTEPASQPTPTRNALGHVVVPEKLNVQSAILVGLQNNVSLIVQRFNTPIQRTQEESNRAAFDPKLSGQISGGRTVTNTGTNSRSGPSVATDSLNATAGISEFLPTGTTIGASITSHSTFYSDSGSNLDAGVSVTQALLRGAGLDVNLASLRSAELATKISQFQLRGFAESLVANIEETYWDLAFAERQVVIVENALNVAQEQLDSTNASIRVGRVAPTERAAAEAQVAFEREQLISAKSNLETTRIRFLQLITPAGQPFWNRTVTLEVQPFVPQGEMDPVDKHVDVALRLRPEINQTKLQIQQNDLAVVQTKNGLLPQLDFFVNLDKTSFSESFGNTFSGLNDPDYIAIAGIRGSYNVGNRAENAAYRAATLTREQTLDSLQNLEQTVQVDVRTAYIAVETARQQIDATRATREANEISLQVEIAKFKAGRSTSLNVAQTQQTLLSSQLNEVQAVTGHLKALVELYRFEGSLLYRRGIDAPGGKPVTEREWH